jgi:hypothetical protein
MLISLPFTLLFIYPQNIHLTAEDVFLRISTSRSKYRSAATDPYIFLWFKYNTEEYPASSEVLNHHLDIAAYRPAHNFTGSNVL